jgi:serine/threonine-protein kinase
MMDTNLHDELQQALGDAYSVERELPAGGMSRVFLAVERSLGRKVVIKVLPPELASGVSTARFEREVTLTAGLQHPHILPVLAVGACQCGLSYYITPFIEGHTLRDRLSREGALPIADATDILRELAGALAYAHSRGVIHRDVKPENVLLSGGHAVLADFGIARAVEQVAQSDRLTVTGGSIGTPGYMAPEQLVGSAALDARVDVFALGVVGYEMFAGRTPFSGNTPEMLAAAYFTEPSVPLQKVRPETPTAIAQAIARALARSPQERFPSASEFRDALGRASAGGVPLVGSRWLTTAAVASALLVAVLGWTIWPGPREVDAPGRKTRAVLPFKNLGPPEDAYFADGITEEVTSRLASLSGLGVISRTSADHYRNSTMPLRDIAQELGAEYVLEGSVRWERDAGGKGRVRVTPQLIRVSDDSHLWAQRYDAELSGVFEVQARIAERVARELAIALRGSERAHLDAHPTGSMEAHDSYMRAEQLRMRAGTHPPSLARAVELYEGALEADPEFALALAKLAITHVTLYQKWSDRREERLVLARRAADSALRVDPTLPEASLALGRYYEMRGQLDSALAAFALAERGRPNDAGMLTSTGIALARRGRWPEALAKVQRAAELDPRSVEANLAAAEAFGLTRDYPAAMRYAERAIAADSDAVDPHHIKAQLLVLLGNRAASTETVRRAIVRLGAERVAASEGFNRMPLPLDSADVEVLERVRPSAFQNNQILYLYWRMLLFDYRRPELAQVYADSLLHAGGRLIQDRSQDYQLHGGLAWINAMLGRHDVAVAEARRTMELMPITRDAVEWGEAVRRAAGIYVRAGRMDDAVDALEQLLGAPSWISVAALRTDPQWAPLRGHPRFERLLGGT